MSDRTAAIKLEYDALKSDYDKLEKENKNLDRVKESYKKVNKKQSDKIKELKKEILFYQKLTEKWSRLAHGQEETNDKHKEEIEKLKKENKEQKEKIDTMNEQMNKIVDLDSLVGTEAECDIQNIFNDEEDEE